ncbi:unnamed protein product [Schistosoma curassoni]|uniref:Uncharacterized protein n=1 Tax=Schistosoma curassoni TaxID=6186 RepID=A0A183KGI9_9TREM|nr:unnamed protein product [Schistosoma curassoni]
MFYTLYFEICLPSFLNKSYINWSCSVGFLQLSATCRNS